MLDSAAKVAPEVMNTRQAAVYLNVHEVTLKVWRTQRRGPPFVKFEDCARYLKSDLQAYLRRHTVKTKAVAA